MPTTQWDADNRDAEFAVQTQMEESKLNGWKDAKKFPEMSLEEYMECTKETREEVAFLAQRIA